jgi:hypothetical protein
MTVVRNYFTNLVPPRPPASGGSLALPASKGVGEAAAAGRAVRDTVELSEGGHKIVNLARGQELAREIRAAPIDEDFFANLKKAQEDIKRITHLFGETIKAAFRQSRGQE